MYLGHRIRLEDYGLERYAALQPFRKACVHDGNSFPSLWQNRFIHGAADE